MSDRYQGSAYRGPRAPPDDRRYAPSRHHRDEHDLRSYGQPRDPFPPSFYPEAIGYGPSRPPRRVHKVVPPPRPWNYSRRPAPRTEEERAALEREREAWEAKEEERYEQRMAEQRREQERERTRAPPMPAADGWRRPEYDADDRMYRPMEYEREPIRPEYGPPQPRRPRSRSPEVDARYERGAWSRGSIGAGVEGRDRPPLDRPGAAAGDRGEGARYPDVGYAGRRSPPSAPHADAHEPPHYGGAADRPPSPRGRGIDSEAGVGSAPPTGPRGGYGRRGGAPLASPAFRGREGSGSAGGYTPGSDREASSYLSPSNARFPRSARDGPPPAAAYRGGHPSFGRGRRDTNPNQYDAYYNGGGAEDGHAGSSPHEASPYSPSTSTPAHLAPRLSRTSSSQTPAVPEPAPVQAPAHFSAAWKVCPDLDAELMAMEASRTAFVTATLLGPKRATIRQTKADLRDAEIELAAAVGKRVTAERTLEIARETADAYSLEENRKEEIQRLMAQQIRTV